MKALTPIRPEDFVLPTAELKCCYYDKKRKVINMASDFIGKPLEFFLHSHHTGKTIHFKAIDEGDIMFDQDQWDGEQQIYRPVENLPGVDYMVIYNQS